MSALRGVTIKDVARQSFSERTRRRLSSLYFLGAVCLIPWIILLAVTQPRTATAHDLVVVSVGVPTGAGIGLIATAILYAGRSPLTAVTSMLTATAIFITGWFRVLTQTTKLNARSVVVLILLIPVIVLLVWVADSTCRGLHTEMRRRWVPVVLVVVAALLTVSLFRIAFRTPEHHVARHLKLLWTGLDTFEVIGLAWTYRALRANAARTAMAASFTGALLLSDAWFNVTSSTGSGRTESIVLAFAEVPLAVLSVAVAYDAMQRLGSTSRNADAVTSPARAPAA